MRIVMFYHSLLSDWNHGNAHFLRGIVTELLLRGHAVQVYEPEDGWSLQHLRKEQGEAAIRKFQNAYPGLDSQPYDLAQLQLDEMVDGADLVLVHEWNPPALVKAIGAHRARTNSYRLLFHDTHHRSVTAAADVAAYDLRHYDGVLAYGRVIRDLYLERGWAARAWIWHEAADTRIFRPLPSDERTGDLVWIGNWGDEERTEELREFLIEPARALGLNACVYGVRYPAAARRALARAGIAYGGWLPNYEAPAVFANFKVTVHIPRRPYVQALPGVPTIRVFEALACGIPLVCAPWTDAEGLFTPGRDFLVARDGAEMKHHLKRLLADEKAAVAQALHGLQTVLARHTCAHRVDELLGIYTQLNTPLSERAVTV